MSTNWIFYTQILSLFTYVGIALGLYALLVKQKDATIQFLQTQLDTAKEAKPDVVLKQLHDRVQIAREEMDRLAKDKKTLQGFNESQRYYIQALTETVKEQQALIAYHEKAAQERAAAFVQVSERLKEEFKQLSKEALVDKSGEA